MNAVSAPVAPVRGRLITAGLLLAGGLLTAAGGQLHPTGSGATLEAHLLSMFEDPVWTSAHTLLLVGAVLNFLAVVAAWRAQAFGPRVQRLLPVVAVGWGFGALELVPRFAVLFAFQAGTAVWLVGTGLRLLRP